MHSSMTTQEVRIVVSLASIFALRMLGLCMLLPVFALEASKLPHASEQLLGLAIGAYGLAQALLQIPFGVLSDRYGRKPLILVGLGLLLLGSLIAAQATSIYALILGRSLQGSGAIGSVIIATLADHTREQIRTRAMAVLGMSIGAAFVLAMVLGPWITQLVGLPGIFNLTAALAIVGVGLLLWSIPKTTDWRPAPNVASWKQNLNALLTDSKLMVLNLGIFVLHASLAALFLVLPWLLQDAGFMLAQLWKLYLAALVLALLVSLKLIALSERKQQIASLQLLAIGGVLVAEGLLCIVHSQLSMFVAVSVFFSAFCVLEASLPTLVSKYAPINYRGAALGVYSSLQFLGIFFGGIIGGWLHGQFGKIAVLSFCMLLAALWLSVSVKFSKNIGVKLWLGA